MDDSKARPMVSQFPPPHYTEKRSQTKTKTVEPQSYGNGSWLVRRTSFTIESTPADGSKVGEQVDRVSMTSSAKSDEKKRLRNLLAKWSDHQTNEAHSDGRSIESSSTPYDASSRYGTTVSIEAGHSARPRTQRYHSMKGLERAASMLIWNGSGRPADAWGKLAKDPELWDDAGDTLVYFGYQRPEASFRVKSSILENTKSDILIGKLRNGCRPAAKPSSHYSPNALRGIKDLNLSGSRKTPPLPGAGRDGGVQIQYEIHFPAPEDITRMDLLRHHTTTRNFFALLKDKPLVGLTYFQALMDLFERLKLWMPTDCNPCEMLVKYLLKNGLHNIANDPGAAAGMLAWSEDVEVRWQEGWRESFVHCTGMYAQVQARPEYRDISNTTCVLLNRAHLELQARIQEVEHRLSTFDFNDMWGANKPVESDARASYDRLRHALNAHFQAQHKRWPPRESNENGSNWLNRTLVGQLQQDFAALYDVYADCTKSGLGLATENECSRDCVKISNDPIVGEYEIGLTKMLAYWDHKHKYAHLPNSLPLLPIPFDVHEKTKPMKSSFFSTKSKSLEKQIIQAYEEARNPQVHDTKTSGSLVDKFRQLERTDQPGDLNPREARKGRWMLIYGILQVLATISVDTPHLYFKDNVSYFLNPHLKGTPPWELAKEHAFEEASPFRSHCWTMRTSTTKPTDRAP